MRKNILAWPFVLMAVFAFCACGDDEETVLSSDCHISSFTLGTVKREIHTTASTGEDSVYTASYDASAYAMRINQLDGTIENHDSLPVNTLKNAMLATIETSGTVIYRQEDDASENWMLYSSTDSIDFTNTLVFRVISADGAAWRDYTVKVNVHQENGDEFVWTKLAEPGLWDAAEVLNTFVWNEKAWVFAREGADVRLFCSDAVGGTQWDELEPDGCGQADIKTLAAFGGKLYMSGTDGTLMMSDDALAWNSVAADCGNLRLLAADDTYLYAIAGQALWHSADGLHWTEEALDAPADFLPVRDFAAVSYTQSDGLRKMLLIGNRSTSDYGADTHAMVWGRGTRSATADARWMYYEVSEDNPYACPRLSPLEALCYGDCLLAFGGASIGGAAHGPLDAIYVSRDNGITWKSSGIYMLPDGVRNTQTVFTATTDGQNYLWLVTGSQVWRGRLNKYGFKS